MNPKEPTHTRTSVLDRVAIGAMSGFSMFILRSIILFGISWKATGASQLPFAPVIYISIGFALLGFLLAENVVIAAVVKAVELLLAIGRL